MSIHPLIDYPYFMKPLKRQGDAKNVEKPILLVILLIFSSWVFSACLFPVNAPLLDKVKTTVMVESSEPLTEDERGNMESVLVQRMEKFGFMENQMNWEGNELTIISAINLQDSSRVGLYRALFDTHELALWETFRVTDPEIASIDTSLLYVESFVPYWEMKESQYFPNILGYSSDESKLTYIGLYFQVKLAEVANLKLVWAATPNLDSHPGKEVYYLYMINTRGNSRPPIQDTDITLAEAIKGEYSRNYEVLLTMSETATLRWSEMTRIAAADDQRMIAIVYDNRVLVSPKVISEIPNGNCVISANFYQPEAQSLARKIAIGRLPYPLSILDQYAIKKE